MGGSVHDDQFIQRQNWMEGFPAGRAAFHQWTKPQEFICPLRDKEKALLYRAGLNPVACMTAGVVLNPPKYITGMDNTQPHGLSNKAAELG